MPDHNRIHPNYQPMLEANAVVSLEAGLSDAEEAPHHALARSYMHTAAEEGALPGHPGEQVY